MPYLKKVIPRIFGSYILAATSLSAMADATSSGFCTAPSNSATDFSVAYVTAPDADVAKTIAQ